MVTLVVELHLESSLHWRDLVSSFNRKYLELRSESLLWKKNSASDYRFQYEVNKVFAAEF